jgi:hypothetical protein
MMSLALLSADLVLADGHIDFLASLGDPLTQALVLGLVRPKGTLLLPADE